MYSWDRNEKKAATAANPRQHPLPSKSDGAVLPSGESRRSTMTAIIDTFSFSTHTKQSYRKYTEKNYPVASLNNDIHSCVFCSIQFYLIRFIETSN